MTRLGLGLCVALAVASLPRGVRADEAPLPIDGIGVEERLGAAVPLDLTLVSPQGAQATLRDALGADKPVVLVLAYSDCPMLCNLVLRGLAYAVRGTERRAGIDFEIVTLSIDPEETPEAAASTQRALAAAAGFPGQPERWRYFLGTKAAIRAVADSVGFRFRYDERTDQYAHPAVVFVLTPEGNVSQYLYDIQLDPKALEEALALAASGRQRASTAVRNASTCFRFDPASSKYAGAIRLSLRLTGLAAVGLLAGIVVVARRRSVS